MISLAWKNIWRNKRRTLLAVLAIAIASLLTPLLFGFLAAWQNGMFEHLVLNTGHLMIRDARWQEVRQLESQLIPGEAMVVQDISASLPEVQVVTWLEVPILLAGEAQFRMVLLIGYEQPLSFDEELSQRLNSGRLPSLYALDEIVIGEFLAESLEVTVGDSVYAYLAASKGSGAASFKVVGLLNDTTIATEARRIFTSLRAAQDLAAPGEATAFKLFFANLKRNELKELSHLQQNLSKNLNTNLTVLTWQQASPDLATVLNLLEPVFLFLSGIFYGLASLLVLNIVYLSLIERIPEFGLILALGAGHQKIMYLVFLETVFIVLTGALVGGGFSWLILLRMTQGFTLPFGLAQVYAQFGLPTVLYADLSFDKIIITVLLATSCSLLATLWPIWITSRLEPVSAMRFTT